MELNITPCCLLINGLGFEVFIIEPQTETECSIPSNYIIVPMAFQVKLSTSSLFATFIYQALSLAVGLFRKILKPVRMEYIAENSIDRWNNEKISVLAQLIPSPNWQRRWHGISIACHWMFLERTEAIRRIRPHSITHGLSQGLTGFCRNLLGAVGEIASHGLEAKSSVEVSPVLAKESRKESLVLWPNRKVERLFLFGLSVTFVLTANESAMQIRRIQWVRRHFCCEFHWICVNFFQFRMNSLIV